MERIETSWGLIIRDQYSLLITIKGVGTIEIYGDPIIRMSSNQIIICANAYFERPVKIIECEFVE
jgi:hypothetical protein